MMQKSILDLFEHFYFLENAKQPILAGRLHAELIKELDVFTEECERLKNHKLSFLKNHLNVGMNKYQVSVPTRMLEDSFLFAFMNHMGEYYVSQVNDTPIDQLKRRVIVRKNQGHFDAYDFWINFIESGDVNRFHNHAGSLSGVIYYDNSIGMPTIFEDDVTFNGKKGDIIMFPSPYFHKVEENKTNKTRISYAYNMEFV